MTRSWCAQRSVLVAFAVLFAVQVNLLGGKAFAQEAPPSMPEGWQQLDASAFAASAEALYASPLPVAVPHDREVVAHAWSAFLNDADFIASAQSQVLEKLVGLFVPRRSRLVFGATEEDRATAQQQMEANFAGLENRLRTRMLADPDYQGAAGLLAVLAQGGWTSNKTADLAAEWMGSHEWQSLSVPTKASLLAAIAADSHLSREASSARWTGFLTAPTTADYTLELVRFHDCDPQVKVWLGDKLVLDTWPVGAEPAADQAFVSSAIPFSAGEPVSLHIELTGRSGALAAYPDASGVGLVWKAANGAKECVPESALSPPVGFGEAGALGLKAEYFSGTELVPAGLVATVLGPGGHVWHAGPVATHQNEVAALVADVRASLRNDTFLEALSTEELRELDRSGIWGQLLRQLPLADRAQVMRTLFAHPAAIRELTATDLGALVEATYLLPGKEHLAALAIWLDSRPQPSWLLGRITDQEAGSYYDQNVRLHRSLGHWLTGPFFADTEELWESRLRRSDGGCDLRIVLITAHSAALQGRLASLRSVIKESLASDSLGGDQRASWLIAQGYVATILRDEAVEPERAIPHLEEALLVAEGSETRFVALESLVAVLGSLGQFDRAGQAIEDFGTEGLGQEAQAKVAAWQRDLDALADYYAGAEARQRAAHRASYRAALEARLAAAVERGDATTAQRIRDILSQLPE